MTRALVFGAGGQVGRALAAARWPETWGVRFLARADGLDLSRPEHVAAFIDDARPDVVINAAAYTAVDRAEEEEALAHRVNAEAPAVMAAAAEACGAAFVHLSTDYVFDGSGRRPWRPDDAVKPLNAYGRTKAAGEAAIASIAGRHAILRTSWVYDETAKNFVTTMLRLADGRDAVRVVADQVGAPTYAPDLAAAVIATAEAAMRTDEKIGIHHACGGGEASWADFARAIFEERAKRISEAAVAAPAVVDIKTDDWPTPARRPKNSRLSMGSFEAVIGAEMRPWREALGDAMDAAFKAAR